MDNQPEPIFKFEGLKNLLRSKGFKVDKAQGYRALEIETVDINSPRSNFEITDEGLFFVIDPIDKTKRQVFLYMPEYDLDQYGPPKYHICNCQTIIQYGRSMYRRANTARVLVRNRNDEREYEFSRLELCKNCIKQMFSAPRTTEDFERIMRKAAEKTEHNLYTRDELDFRGYTRDWEQISLAYRNMRHYTCEECGVHIEDPFDYEYMHVHHISGNKADNRTENLKCLCIKCHSMVDERHKKNFSSKAQQIRLREFTKKYGALRNT